MNCPAKLLINKGLENNPLQQTHHHHLRSKLGNGDIEEIVGPENP